jgi:hypothetical protein
MFTTCVSGWIDLAVVDDGRLRGYLMLTGATLGLLIGIAVVILIFKSWRRTLERQRDRPKESGTTSPDPWEEAGRRLDEGPGDPEL